jgi:hypothetical protein
MFLFLEKERAPLRAVTDPRIFLVIFSKLFEFVIHEHVSHYTKFKLDPRQRGSSKSQCTVANLATYLEFLIPLAGFQHQAQTTDIYFEFSIKCTSDVTHILVLHKLSDSDFLIRMQIGFTIT